MSDDETRYGATPEEWARWSCDLSGFGLVADLLPVVSDPRVPISPASKMKGLGKTPSIVNGQGNAAGIPEWTGKIATPREIEKWAADPRHGICLQTRRVRAIDIDIDDADKAQEVEDFIAAELGGKRLPCRSRPKSGKRLLIVHVEGTIPYKSFPVEGGVIEWLGNGQQCVVEGTHVDARTQEPSGRYEWRGLGHSLPGLPLERYLQLRERVRERFATGPGGEARLRQRGEDIEKEDARADWLDENWENYGWGAGGQLFVACPFADGHSSSSGDTECAYFPAGTGGFEQGHWKCLHASCAGRSDDDFDRAVGYGAHDFEVVPANSQEPAALAPRFVRDKQGRIEATVDNLMRALQCPRWLGTDIAVDDFNGELMFSPHGRGEWQRFADDDRTELRLRLERFGFKSIKRDDLRDIVRLVGRTNRFDSAQVWLDSLEWDGEARVERFLVEHFGTEDSPYTCAVSRYWWTAHAARILFPGCQVDMVPVLVSPEGRYKSTTLQALTPSLEQFTEIDLASRDADLSRQIRGKLLGELGELKGLNKRETADLKAKITSRLEEWRPVYVESFVQYLRRIVFVGTTNDEAFMAPAIGKRRWLPVIVNGADPLRLAAVRDQLWAEGREIVRARVARNARGEVEWEDAYRLAPAEREAFEAEDPWTTGVDHWLSEQEEPPSDFTTTAVFAAIFSAFDRTAQNPTPNEQSRMCGILQSRGFKQVRKTINGQKRRVWTTAGPEAGALSGPA